MNPDGGGHVAKKTAVVTGAARGIGEAIARKLHDDGYSIVVCDIDGPGAEAVAAQVEGKAVAFDIGDLDAVAAAAEQIKEASGGVDVLVNNAGWDHIAPFASTDRALWEKIVQINLLGPIALTHGLLPSLRERRGRIVNISSDAGRTGSKGEVVYAGAKGGVLGFTRALARELAADSVTVNAVCPGPTDTPLNREVAAANPKLMDALKRAIPLARAHDRIGKPEDIANAVAYVASDGAEWVTGQTLSVNGGLLIA
jgi:2-hydroxycyclohexanecarboxyl-CoA dehydrogenase